MNEWLSPAQAARELGVSRTTILRAIATGRLTAHKFGVRREGRLDRRGLSISRSALDVFIKRSAIQPRIYESKRARVEPPANLVELARKLTMEEGR